MAGASSQSHRLHIVTPDGCTVDDSTPLQGFWTQAQYLRLTNQSNRLIEFTDGYIEVPPMSTQQHLAISQFLFLALYLFVRGIGGRVFYAPLRLLRYPSIIRIGKTGRNNQKIKNKEGSI